MGAAAVRLLAQMLDGPDTADVPQITLPWQGFVPGFIIVSPDGCDCSSVDAGDQR